VGLDPVPRQLCKAFHGAVNQPNYFVVASAPNVFVINRLIRADLRIGGAFANYINVRREPGEYLTDISGTYYKYSPYKQVR